MKWPPRWMLWLMFWTGLVAAPLVALALWMNDVLGGPIITRIQGDLSSVELGLARFRREQGNWALPKGYSLTEDYVGELTPDILAQIGFNDLHPKADGPHYFPDAWGRPLQVRMDVSGDHKLANPDTQSRDLEIRESAPASLDQEVLVFSCGPDREPYTADDILCSREPKLRPRTNLSALVSIAVASVFYSSLGLSFTRRRLPLLRRSFLAITHDY